MQQRKQQNTAIPLINDKITVERVRLIESDGSQVGIVTSSEALERAQSVDLDLVLIVPDSDPPVAKIMNHGRYLFSQKKAKMGARKKQTRVQIKEVKFRPVTEEGDYQIKLRSLVRFLKAHNKARIAMRFRGREMNHQELGINLLNRLEKDLEEYGIVESAPKMEGRQFTMVMTPKTKKLNPQPKKKYEEEKNKKSS